LELSQDVYERVQRIAEAMNAPADLVLPNVLSWIFGIQPQSYRAILPSLSDAQLWAVAYLRLSPDEQTHLVRLVDKRKNTPEPPTSAEVAEMDTPSQRINELTLARSEALYVLQQRGYDSLVKYAKTVKDDLCYP
jgi:hypothetical protein